ncbi:HTH-type transcriptional regulator CysB [Aquisphaera giovannonii]|uniref:HTH-type transcriptional regulator CysB n=1 Tax=Aquisphaera giovannonii TaxID=406548 RepID=A0A5B9W8U2_9BACT|nr:LysR family transcriptional regulator [Aquisphaera giovannonii]QEH36694.1 HTH-type transcriptional regulator CysB [Aquisphaera giovannonii]
MRKPSPPQDGQGNRLRKLRSFCYAAQSGSISRAAEQAGLSQPSVSLQIQSLEVEFHARLFQRRGPKIELTPEGQALYRLARPLVESLDSLPATFHANRHGLEAGRLTIAAGESTILYILPGAIKDYAAAHPGIELKLLNVSGRDGLKLLRNDSADLAVGSMIEVPEDISYTPAFRYDPMLIAARDHPLALRPRVTIKDVARYPLILPPQHLTTWRVVDYVFHKYGLSYRVALEAGGWEVIKRYVAIGLGISVVTSLCLDGTEDLAAIPFHRYFPQRTYGVVQRKGRIPSPQATRFIEALTARAKDQAASRGRRRPASPGRPGQS